MDNRWIRWPADSKTRTGREPFGYGGDYNPEQWDESVWREDARLMRDAGVSIVTVGVFSWATIQPAPDSWEFGWLDRVMDLLGENGIAVDLATATASAPNWLARQHPDVLAVDRFGNTVSQGGRQAWSPSSRVYRKHSLALVQRMAERYGQHPALALWHVSNELGGHNSRCYGEESQRAFQSWLKERYHDSLDTLNRAWGTTVWSQHYSDWSEVEPPRATFTDPNPSLVLDFDRFSSDQLRSQLRAESEILRRVTPDVPITTNMVLFDAGKNMAYSTWTDDVDIVSSDHYLRAETGAFEEADFSADRARGLAQGASWMLMETAVSGTSWRPVNPTKRRGQLRRDAFGYVARGSDTVCFFQWRAAQAGAERFHSAMLPHAGEDSDIFRDVVALGHDLRACTELVGTRVRSDCALILSEESWWALERSDHPHNALTFMDAALPWHRAMTRLGFTVDIVAPSADLSAYDLIVAPQLYLVSTDDAARISERARKGATVVIGPFSGVVNEHDHIHPGGYTAAFNDLLGIRVEDVWPLLDDEAAAISGATGETLATRWAEVVRLRDATAVAHFSDGDLTGLPAVTRVSRDRGEAWYVAATIDEVALERLFAQIAESRELPLPEFSGAGLRITTRQGAQDRNFHVLINHGTEPARVVASGIDLLDGSVHENEVIVPAGGVRVIQGVLPRSSRH